MEFAGKSIGNSKIVTSGAGAAALACLDLLVDLGAKRENIFVTDTEGVVYKGRKISMNARKGIYARDTNARTLADVIGGADVFLGLSAGGVLRPEMVKQMGETPLIMALANPTPEIEPGRRAGGAAGRNDLHRTLGLSQSSQQRPLFSLHVSRRPRCRRLDDQ